MARDLKCGQVFVNKYGAGDSLVALCALVPECVAPLRERAGQPAQERA